MAKKTGGIEKRKKKEELARTKKSSPSSSPTKSERGERERTKWRKKRREIELKKVAEQLEQHRIREEAELAKRKTENQKKEFRKRQEIFEKVFQDAESGQKAVENVMSDYRESRNAIKVQLYTDSNDFIQTQQIEKSHFNAAGDRLRSSEIQLSKLESELKKTKQIREEYYQDSMQSWFSRFWKYLY
ncbi:DUF4200 domain-containing protein [Caenorhabditis elegans]|uniref:DUF4200 domain-containing protein n=1 Tax=Caenorhabditis elegans TaxID=6239 RepID=Q19670_CAEEL|nr:DUF4200 domain-containing protein [Caenorhabditis elegans]CAA95800.1 DUF4200 domain-containing protein [Caenorhabditis elegans]|eukprot:NP_492059.1 Uncharacterized protein CELE_F21C3.6 [Caenorhabditis elegans]